MLRLARPGYHRFSQTREFDATYGGGESNVTVSLANYGIGEKFVTRLPKYDIEKYSEGVIKYLEFAEALRGSIQLQYLYSRTFPGAR